jgi:hypothetical protein
LNHFLTGVREAALEISGSWELNLEFSSLDYTFMLSEKGINLEADLPEAIFRTITETFEWLLNASNT